MRRLSEVLGLLEGRCDEALLLGFIREEWVLPQAEAEDWWFEEIDIARCELILHLQREMQVSDESMGLVLHLIDQIYGLRQQVKTLAFAIEKQPRRVQAEIFTLLRDPDA